MTYDQWKTQAPPLNYTEDKSTVTITLDTEDSRYCITMFIVEYIMPGDWWIDEYREADLIKILDVYEIQQNGKRKTVKYVSDIPDDLQEGINYYFENYNELWDEL